MEQKPPNIPLIIKTSLENRAAWERIKQKNDELYPSSEQAHVELARMVEEVKLERELKLEQVQDPTTLIESKLKKMSDNAFLAIGEASHHASGVLEFETKLVETIAKQRKIQSVFLEEDETMMPWLDQYYKSGIMPEVLRKYLTSGFVREDTLGHEYKIKLVEKCRELVIPVLFLDRSSRIEDRDKDWSKKIKTVIGNEIEGLYILIAGRNHSSHSENTYPNRGSRIPVVAILDRKYKGKIVSVQCQGTSFNTLSRAQSVCEIKFNSDLEKLGRAEIPSAILTEGSPYENLPMTIPQITTRMGEAFDVMVSLPGKNLFRYT